MASKNQYRGAPIKVIAPKLPDDIAQCIGNIIYKWSVIQLGLTHLIADGFDIPIETSRALTYGMEMHVLSNVLVTLSITDKWIKNEETRNEIKKLAKDIKKHSESRNACAHGVFIMDLRKPYSNLEQYLIKKSEHRIKPATEKIELKKLQDDLAKANEINDRIYLIGVKLRSFSKKSP